MDRQTHRMVSEIITILERHGHHAPDREHADQAITMITDLARTYDGTWQPPSPGYPGPAARPPEPAPPAPQAEQDTVLLAGPEVSTVLAALAVAADEHRDRAQLCADCPDQSCPACQARLHAARAFDRLAGRIYHPGRADPDAGREAGQ